MSQTTVNLGYVLKNRGEYIASPETRYYHDNVVQYNGSSFIAAPVDYNPETNPLAYVTTPPYDTDPNQPNEGWKVFASDAAYVNSFMTWEENPEWVEVHLDAEQKILYGVKTDGEFFFGAGCPQQVKEYINNKISELSLDEYESIVAFLDGLLDSDTTLKMMLNSINEEIQLKANQTDMEEALALKANISDMETALQAKANTADVQTALEQAAQATQEALDTKVDKEQDKSLISSDFASSQSSITNPEYFQVTTDSEDKILEGIKPDGTKIIGGNLSVGGSASINGDVTVKGSVTIDGTSYKVIENSEYVWAIIDNDDKILCGIKTNGKFVADIDGIDEKIQEAINQMQTIIDEAQASIDEKIAAIDEMFDFISWIEDPEERSEITTDAEGKIISYRDSEGVKHEEVGVTTNNIKANNLELSAEGLTDLEKALKENGFSGGQGDWSDYVSEDGDKPLHLSEPRCAILNILSDFNLSRLSKEGRPEAQEGVNYNIPIEVQFWDMQGNYLKKPCLVSGQGNSSFGYAKRNLALDFFDTSVYDTKGKLGGGDAFAIKFGNWVAQDSFHLKAFYTDFLRGASICAYKIADQVELSRGIYKDRPWKRGLLSKHTFGSDQITSEQIDDMSLQIDNNARCMPDAFPVIVYQNGSFWGIYAWCIKKHRDNYHMNKSTAEHIHLDGSIGNVAFLTSFPYIWVEVRNPKSLYANDGSDYAEGKSLATPELVSQWITAGVLPDGTEITSKIKKNLQLTAKVWEYIDNIHIHFHEVKDAAQVYESSSKTAEDLAAFKAVFETYFDAENLIDYEVVQLAVDDPDGLNRNWQWVTYDGIKWYTCEYDKDMSFGNMFNGVTTRKVKTQAAFMGDDNTPMEFIKKYYAAEVKARWNELKSLGILTTDNFIDIINSWIERIGEDNYEKEWQKWPYSPCNRDRNDYIDSHWKLLDYTTSIPIGYVEYNDETEYHVGDTCYVDDTGYGFYWVYECIENSVGNNPMISIPQRGEPIRHGYRDSLWRFREFIDANLALYNEWFNQN